MPRLFFVLFAVIALPVVAAEPTHYIVYEQPQATTSSANGLYVGAEIGYTKNRIVGQADQFNEDAGNNYGGFVGYQFNKYFGVEAGYNQTDDFEKTSQFQGADITANNSLKTYSIDLLGYAPVTNRVDLMAGVGYERARLQSEGTATDGIITENFDRRENVDAFRFTVGSRLRMTDHLHARALYRYKDYGSSDSDVPQDAGGALESRNDFNVGLAVKF